MDTSSSTDGSFVVVVVSVVSDSEDGDDAFNDVVLRERVARVVVCGWKEGDVTKRVVIPPSCGTFRSFVVLLPKPNPNELLRGVKE